MRFFRQMLLVGVTVVTLISGCGFGSDSKAGPVAATTGTPTADVINTSLEGVGEKLDPSLLNEVERARHNITAGPLGETGVRGQKDYLVLRAMGQASDSGGLWFFGRGFTPGGACTITVTYPEDSEFNGQPYSFVGCEPIPADGSLSSKRWDPNFVALNSDPPAADPDGIYGITVKDNTTGNAVSTQFVIRKKRG